MASHSSTLAWKIPWAEEAGGLHGIAKSRTRLGDFTFTFHFHVLEKEMATHSTVLAWRTPGTGEPGWLPSMGSRRVGHDGSALAAAAAEIQKCSFSDHPPDGAMGLKHRVYQPLGRKQSEATSQLSDHSLSMSPGQ